MRLLLDTNAVIFCAHKSNRLSNAAYDFITDPDSEIFVSAETAAELACLERRKNLQITNGWREWFRNQLTVNTWICLPVTLEIIEEAYALPEPIHRDPADRILIATARLENFTLITTHELILKYPHVAARC